MRVIILQDNSYLNIDEIAYISETKKVTFNGMFARFEIVTNNNTFIVSLEIPSSSTTQEIEDIYQMVEETRVNLKTFLTSTDPLEVEYIISL
jgi:hypothetical protein